MVDRNLTHLYIVQDRSGSMELCRSDTEGGFNAFITEQKKVPGICKVTLAQFDTSYEIVYAQRMLDEVPPLRLEPRGGTALLDAIGRTIVEAGSELAALAEDDRPGAVILAINTDGEENSSREFTLPMVKTMIERQSRDYQWLFVYLGANQDAIAVAGRMGIGRGQTMTYDVANAGAAFRSLSHNTGLYRGATARGASYAEAVAQSSFTDTQREDAGSVLSQPPAKHPVTEESKSDQNKRKNTTSPKGSAR